MASNVLVSPMAGQGNKTFTVTGKAPNTGRNVLNELFLVYSTNFLLQKNLTVKQAGKIEFLDINTAAVVDRNGGAVTITGTSNTDLINFSFLSNEIGLTLTGSYVANGKPANINQLVPFDPGATKEYTFSITFEDVDANTENHNLVSVLRVGNSVVGHKQCVITQGFGTGLSVSPLTVNIDKEGALAGSLIVDSDEDWTIVSPGWSDGSGDVLITSVTSGNAGVVTVNVTSDANEGLDRTAEIMVQTASGWVIVEVVQEGKREVFDDADGEFLTADGEEFWVLKG